MLNENYSLKNIPCSASISGEAVMDLLKLGCQVIDENLNYRYVNQAFATQFNVQITACLKKNVLAVLPSLTDTDLIRIYQFCLTNKKEHNLEYLYEFDHDLQSWFNVSIIPLAECLLVITEDITKRKEAERLVKFAQAKAEEANQLKSQFLNNISHELRTPLHGISGIAQLLFHSKLDDKQRDSLIMLNTCTEQLSLLIEKIIATAALETSSLNIMQENFNLKKLLFSISSSWKAKAGEKNLSFSMKLDPELPELLYGDRAKIGQILSLLLENAVKFTAAGGITVNVRKDDDTLFLVHRDTIAVQFSIADTGIGIPREKLKIIFDSFVQADSSLTKKFAGAGLGLSIARQLTEILEGVISVESHETKGSIFFFTLPLRKTETP